MWTEAPELTTGVTNLLIVAVGAMCAVRICRGEKRMRLQDKLWLVFFLSLAPAGLVGFVAHAVEMSAETNRVVWGVLMFLLGLVTLSFAAAGFAEVLGRKRLRRVMMVNVGLEVIFYILACALAGVVEEIHLIFVTYTGIVVVAILGCFVKGAKKKPQFRWYILAIGLVVMAGVMELVPAFTFTAGWEFNQDSVCHLLLAAAVGVFGRGRRKKIKICPILGHIYGIK